MRVPTQPVGPAWVAEPVGAHYSGASRFGYPSLLIEVVIGLVLGLSIALWR
jgi:hypothetical protein